MKKLQTIDSKILKVLADGDSHSEWDIASRLFDWNKDELHSKHGAWIRSIVQSLWKMEQKGLVGHFWASHGAGVAGSRMWFSAKDRGGTGTVEMLSGVEADRGGEISWGRAGEVYVDRDG